MGKSGEFAHCRVCRRNHDQGKGHRYSASHKKALEQMLAKASDRIRGIRSSLERPAAASQEGHRFWCWFCEEDVVDRSSLFAWSEGIYHLASSKHLKNVKKFCGEQGLDVKCRSEYSFTHKEVEKWEADCNRVASSKQGAGTTWPDAANNIQQTEWQNLVLSRSSVDPLLAVLKDEKTQVPKQQQQDSVRQTVSASSENLASVAVPPLLPGEGNVHTGAPPPWMTDVTGSNKGGEQVNGRTMSKRRQREAQRLERRVGAAWAKRRRAELERDKAAVAATAAEALGSNWLPSFGGVWQSGTRSESRKAFLDSANFRAMAGRDPPKVEPYIGKRKRTATNRDGAGGGVLESSG